MIYGENEVRTVKPFLDLYKLVETGNTDVVRRSVGNDQDRIVAALALQTHDKRLASEDILALKKRMRGFLKSTVAHDRYRPRILYISDCHCYHDRICRELDNRGFSGFEEMNTHMINQWNNKVTSRDDVFILGDFSITKPDATIKILEQLNGKLHLIIGNHDKYIEDRHYLWNNWFRSIEYYQEIHDNGRNVILSHYPIFCYKGQYRKDKNGFPLTYMLYGHVHNTQDEILVDRFIKETRTTEIVMRDSAESYTIPCNMINCFCMFSNYQPMTLDEWIMIDRKRRDSIENTGLSG